MKQEIKELDFSNQVISVGIDVHITGMQNPSAYIPAGFFYFSVETGCL